MCASQVHLCITNGWRPAQLNKAFKWKPHDLAWWIFQWVWIMQIVTFFSSSSFRSLHLSFLYLSASTLCLHSFCFLSYLFIDQSSSISSPLLLAMTPWLQHLPQSLCPLFLSLHLSIHGPGDLDNVRRVTMILMLREFNKFTAVSLWPTTEFTI